MLETKLAYERAGLSFEKHAVAVTQEGSQLDKVAVEGQWTDRFPMWDWVGGRTSELSAVGLLPAALQGFDIDNLIRGAKDMDEITRASAAESNPAMGLALAWHASGNGKGDRNLVILPYKDRLELLSKYLQQLIMESIGKQHDLEGNVVNQGLSVFGNKGSTDQHSFVQQLRDGRDDFIVTFIEVLSDRESSSQELEPGLTAGDYLQGFLLGTRMALSESGRQSVTITVRDVSAYTVGALIGLFERAVGFYAALVGINAYHQPGVEAGKKAAAGIVDLKTRIRVVLESNGGVPMTAQAIAQQLDNTAVAESVFKICKRLAVNPQFGVHEIAGATPDESSFKG
jgi:glucose-6-phosphate isomerase